MSLPEILDDLERQLILKAYKKANGVKTETARLLGIKTSALTTLDKYGIALPTTGTLTKTMLRDQRTAATLGPGSANLAWHSV
jgi:hypothetical protein